MEYWYIHAKFKKKAILGYEILKSLIPYDRNLTRICQNQQTLFENEYQFYVI